VHLALWHGWELPLLLSVLTFAGGVVLALSNRRAQQVLATGSGVLSGEGFYLVVLRALAHTARRVTGVVQNGSLPVYAGVILTTAALAPAVVLIRGGSWPDWPTFGSIAELPIAGLVVLAALGAAAVRRRFHAAIFLSVAGYAMAGVFVLYGAPDLALTQVAVETLSTVVFVLVLRKLPDRFERQSSTRRRLLRAGVAALVGLTVFGFALVANTYRGPSVVSDEMTAKAVPEAHGRNVVNVILIDFRGLDTLGEITVLAAASIGAVALARVGRRPDARAATRLARRDGAAAGGPPRGTTSDPTRVVFVDVTAQLIFHVVLMTSLWLLFSGHNRPGGGFVGGLLAGSAIALRYVVGGIREVRGWTRIRPWTVLGTGVLLAVGTAIFPLLRGQQVLDVASRSVQLPLLGDLHLTSALVFDVGVYLTVVGMVLMIFEAFGDEPVEAQP
jgi:multicomponent Na+:H+ antiporter subunit A